MAVLLLALASSVAYGFADFTGGLASRGAHVLRVVVVAAPASLAIELVLLPAIGARWSAPALLWGAASGLGSAASFVLLYRCLALGPMSVLSPVTAVVSGALPVAVGLIGGERVGAPGVAGIGLAVAAVVLVSAAPDTAASDSTGTRRPSRRALIFALGAGAAIAIQLVCLHGAPFDSGLAPLLAGRATSSILLLVAAGAWRRRLGVGRPRVRLAAGAGILDALANLAFLVAARHGELAVVAVVVALYPAATVILARTVLAERLHRVQLAGLGVAGAAVVLLALS